MFKSGKFIVDQRLEFADAKTMKLKSLLKQIQLSLLGFALLACGQSGTEGGSIPLTNCVCRAQGDYTVRASVLSVAPMRVSVLEIFGDVPVDLIAVGDEIGGSVSTELPCNDTGAPLSATNPEIGDEILVLLRRGGLDSYPECPEYLSCTEGCGPMPESEADPTDPEVGEWDVCDGDCVTGTLGPCRARRSEALLASDLLILPWQENLDFGQLNGSEIVVPTSQLALLNQDEQTCNDVFSEAFTESL